MKWLERTSHSLIGLDIGRRRIKAAQASIAAALAAGSARNANRRPLEASELRRLAQAIHHGPFHGRSVVLAAPADKLISGILELPPRSSGAPIEQLAASELGRRHNADLATMEVASWDLPAPVRAAKGTYVMALGCPHADAEALLDLVENEGLSVAAVEPQATALARACEGLFAGSGAGAVLDIGYASAQLVLVHQSIVVYHRNLPKCGVQSLARSVARSIGGDEALAESLLAAARAGAEAGP